MSEQGRAASALATGWGGEGTGPETPMFPLGLIQATSRAYLSEHSSRQHVACP